MNSTSNSISLSDLIKKSARQLCYLRKNKVIQPATEAQIEGNKIAIERTQSLYAEMRGTFSTDNITIYYAIDEVQVNDKAACLIEHKHIRNMDEVELWYRNASLLQTAVYQAFSKVNKNTLLETATFFVKEGNPKLEIDLKNRYIRSELHFGTEIYSVLVNNPQDIVNFYIQKSNMINDYDLASDWDKKYKHREFDYLHNHITYRLIQPHEV